MHEVALQLRSGNPSALAEIGRTEQALAEARPLADRLEAAGDIASVGPRAVQLRLHAERGTPEQAPGPEMILSTARGTGIPDLIALAFTALGACPSRREIGLVAKALRACEDSELEALVGPADRDAPFDHDACHVLQEIATEAKAGPFTGLDLYTELVRPGWNPFEEMARRRTAAGCAGRGVE